jgi:RecB family exonuclease
MSLAQRASVGDDDPGGATSPLTPPLSLSFTKLDAYNRCPRCFYLTERFGLREPPGVNMAMGSAAHAGLHRYYLEFQSADAEGRPTPGVDRLVELARSALEDAWPRSLEIPSELWTQLRGQLRTMHTRLHDPAAHVLHLEQSVRMAYEHRGTHEISAKLDRIDQVGPGRFRIIDYKTGEATRKKLEPQKDDLQLGIYAMALANLFHEEEGIGGTAEYWVLSTGEVGSIDLGSIDLNAVRKRINKAIDGMLDGAFAPAKGCKKGCGDFALD